MSVHNGGRPLAVALDSIWRQTFTDFELIVVNDGSTDETAGLLASAGDRRLRVLHTEHQGLTLSLNLALSVAQGEYSARMDADDVAHPERLAHQVEFLDLHSAVGLCGTWAYIIDEHGRVMTLARPPIDDAAIRAQLLWDNAFFHSTWMFRTELVRSMGGYDGSVTYAQDYELASRIAREAQLANLAIPLLSWRRARHSISGRRRDEQRLSVATTSFRNLSESVEGRIDHDWFWRLRDLWDGRILRLQTGDGRCLADLLRHLPPASGRTVFLDLVTLAAAARPTEAIGLIRATWRRFPAEGPGLLHPRRLVRVATGPFGLRASRLLRQTLRGY